MTRYQALFPSKNHSNNVTKKATSHAQETSHRGGYDPGNAFKCLQHCHGDILYMDYCRAKATSASLNVDNGAYGLRASAKMVNGYSLLHRLRAPFMTKPPTTPATSATPPRMATPTSPSFATLSSIKVLRLPACKF